MGIVDSFENFSFANPSWLWLLLLIPLLVVWYFLKRKKLTAPVIISSVKGFRVEQGLLSKLRPILFIMEMAGLALLILAMARPRFSEVTKKVETKNGIDIVMAVDISLSMMARDLKPDRLEALKSVATNFVNERPNDRIGLVIYAGEAYTQIPLTSDKKVVLNAIKNIDFNQNIEQGTAIGMGLATAVNRIKDSKAKSKVIILLTDGVNNTGEIDPLIATELAKEYGIKVYTIGIGTNGMAMSPVAKMANGQFRFARTKVEIDQDLLKKIAQETGGRYFRATDKSKLQDIYEEINSLEKSKIKEYSFTDYTEKFRALIIVAGVLFLLEFILRNTVFRSFV